MAPSWSEQESKSAWAGWRRDESQQRRDRRKFAELINEKLTNLQERAELQGEMFKHINHVMGNMNAKVDHVLTSCSGLWHTTQQVMALHSRLDAVEKVVLESKPAEPPKVQYVEVPKYVEIPKFVEIPVSVFGAAHVHEPLVQKSSVDNKRRADTFVSSHWEMIVERAILCHRHKRTKRNLVHAEAQASIEETFSAGVWEKLEKTPSPGDIVRVDKEFVSGEERGIALKKDDFGIVVAIDDDGDADVHFPFLHHVVNKHRWVFKTRFGNLSKHYARLSVLSPADVSRKCDELEKDAPTI